MRNPENAKKKLSNVNARESTIFSTRLNTRKKAAHIATAAEATTATNINIMAVAAAAAVAARENRDVTAMYSGGGMFLFVCFEGVSYKKC